MTEHRNFILFRRCNIDQSMKSYAGEQGGGVGGEIPPTPCQEKTLLFIRSRSRRVVMYRKSECHD